MKPIRKRSGEVNSHDRLVGFLYILMREHLTAGEIESLMKEHVDPIPEGDEFVFSNGWLAEHAKDLAKRLK